MRVLYFGTYERDYPRNAQVISCLRRAGVDVVELHVSVWEGRREKWSARAAAGLRVAGAQLLLLRRPRFEYDVVLVGYPGHADMPLARRVAAGRPLVFNPLVSLHDTMVGDRRLYSDRSPAARTLAWLDRRAFGLADLVVADTAQNAQFLATIADLPPAKTAVCFVGAEDRFFRPGWRRTEPFRCLFVGKLIPLHGIDTIVEAARLAPEIAFRVIGSGQLDEILEGRPPNLEWVRWVEYEELPHELWEAGCALGIFGTSEKASRVIPNKAFQAIACGTPLITADTPAAQELFADGRDALLVPVGDPEALAGAVRRLAADAELARRIGNGGRKTYERRASEEVLGAQWKALMESVLP